MPDAKNLGWGTIIVAILAFVGTLVGSTIDGHNQRQVEQDRFEANLVLRAFESDDRQEILKYLQLITDLGLVKDEHLVERLASVDSSRVPTGISFFSLNEAQQSQLSRLMDERNMTSIRDIRK